jgi:hypothetical protein
MAGFLSFGPHFKALRAAAQFWLPRSLFLLKR